MKLHCYYSLDLLTEITEESPIIALCGFKKTTPVTEKFDSPPENKEVCELCQHIWLNQ